MLTQQGILNPEPQDEGVEEVAHCDSECLVLGEKLKLWMHLGVELCLVNKQTEEPSDETSKEAS